MWAPLCCLASPAPWLAGPADGSPQPAEAGWAGEGSGSWVGIWLCMPQWPLLCAEMPHPVLMLCS